jgi:FtsH-binding integral membrane protein
MSHAHSPSYTGAFPIAADVGAVERLNFIRRTYLHLAGAIAAFVALEAVILSSSQAERIMESLPRNKLGVLVYIGLFMAVHWIAEKWAQSSTSLGMQYLGLGIYVVAEALFFVPLLYVSAHFGGESVIPTAAIITLMTFAGLTLAVFFTKADFTWLGGLLWVGGMAAMGLVVCGILFDFNLGTVFTVAMIALAAGYILYDTSNVLHRYHTNQHVAASLALFASVALLFWYVLRFLNSRR